MKRNLWFAALLCGAAGCAKDPISTSSTNNRNVPVSLLFEHDGVKVYRFYDGGRTRYYADARGKVMGSHTEGGGKNSHTVEDDIPTVTAEAAK